MGEGTEEEGGRGGGLSALQLREHALRSQGKVILLKRRLQHDKGLLVEAERLFGDARDRKMFPFGKKKLSGMYQHQPASVAAVI